MIYDGKEPVEVQSGGAVDMNILECWTTEVYSVDFLIGVAVVAVRSKLVGDEGSGEVLSGESFEVDSYGKNEVVGHGEGDTIS